MDARGQCSFCSLQTPAGLIYPHLVLLRVCMCVCDASLQMPAGPLCCFALLCFRLIHPPLV